MQCQKTSRENVYFRNRAINLSAYECRKMLNYVKKYESKSSKKERITECLKMKICTLATCKRIYYRDISVNCKEKKCN